MQTNQEKIWFPAKTYGWGWGMPNCWQGWVVLAAWVALLEAGAFLLLPHIIFFVAYVAVLSGILVAIAYLKGEKPRWRWGKG